MTSPRPRRARASASIVAAAEDFGGVADRENASRAARSGVRGRSETHLGRGAGGRGRFATSAHLRAFACLVTRSANDRGDATLERRPASRGAGLDARRYEARVRVFRCAGRKRVGLYASAAETRARRVRGATVQATSVCFPSENRDFGSRASRLKRSAVVDAESRLSPSHSVAPNVRLATRLARAAGLERVPRPPPTLGPPRSRHSRQNTRASPRESLTRTRRRPSVGCPFLPRPPRPRPVRLPPDRAPPILRPRPPTRCPSRRR